MSLYVFSHFCNEQTSLCVLSCADDSECSSYQSCSADLGYCVTVLNTPCAVHADCDENWETNPKFYCDPRSSSCKYFSRLGGNCYDQECGMLNKPLKPYKLLEPTWLFIICFCQHSCSFVCYP